MSVTSHDSCSPYNKKTWETYTEIILHEAALFTGQKVENIDDKIKEAALKIRPFLAFNFPQFFQPSGSITAMTNSILTNIFKTKSSVINENLTQTDKYMNLVFQLSSYHYNLKLTIMSNSIALISVKICEIIIEMNKVDQKRAAALRNTFYYRCFAVLGAVFWVSGFFAKARWPAGVWLVTAGKIACLISALIWGFNWLYHHNDDASFKEKYQKIGKTAEEVLSILPFYDDRMQLQLGPSSVYHSPYKFQGEKFAINLPPDTLNNVTYPFPEQK